MKTKKQKIGKTEKNKIINTLMAFYQMVCNIVDDTQKDVMKKMFSLQGRLFQLIVYHAQIVKRYGILVPEVDESYVKYCMEFKEVDDIFIKTFDETVEKVKKDGSVGYII